MAQEVREIKVLSVVDNIGNGGAGRAAYRIHLGVNAVAQGVRSKMFVKAGRAQEDIATLAEFLPKGRWFAAFDWVVSKIKNKIQHAVWRPYKKTQDKSFKSDLRGTWLNGALQKQEYDVLHLHWINKRFIKIEDLPTNKPIVWTLHDSWPFCGTCHYFLDCKGYQHECGSCPQLGSMNPNDLSHKVWVEKKEVFDKLDLHIVSPSRWLADCARQSGLFAGRDIRVIPNCLDTDVFRPLSKAEIVEFAEHQQNAVVSRVLREATQEKGLAKPLILYGAANAASDRRKGFASLLSALQILDKQGFEANLVVFGASETDLPLNFEHISVTFVGFVSDVNLLVWLYNAADVMVVPSLTENLSCAIMEALSCGTPICCFNIGGNGDMVEHQVNGYLAREKDCTDLALGIRDCITHSAEWGTAARESVVKKYAVDVVAKQYVELYKDVAGKEV